MSYIQEQKRLAKAEGRNIVVKKSYQIDKDQEGSCVVSDFELKINKTWFEIVEKTDNIVIGKMLVSSSRKIEICMHHDYIGASPDTIPDIYIAAISDDNETYLIQKGGYIFTILQFPAMKGWFWEMHNCANYKANTPSGYSELWFCWRKVK